MSIRLRLLAALTLWAFGPAAAGAQTSVPSQQTENAEAAAVVVAAENLVNQSRYPQAREQATRALSLYEQLGDQRGIGRARHVLGLVATMMGDAADGRMQFEAAIAAFEAAGYLRGRGRATLGLLPVLSPDPATGARLLERTVNDARTTGDVDLEGRALHFWGDALFHVGNNEGALEKLEQAASIFSTGDPLALGTVHNSLGRLYRTHGRLDLALQQQLIALSMHEKFPATFQHVQSLNAVGVTYQALGDSGQAQTYLGRALVMAEQTGSPRVQDHIRGNLASTFIEQGNHGQAAQLLERIVAHTVDTHTSARYSSLSNAYLKMGRREDALAAAEKAMDRCSAGDATACVNALRTRSIAYAALGNRPAALTDLRAAIDRLEEARRRLLPADFLKQQFSLAHERIYSTAIGLQVEERQPEEALATAERARARAFVDLLAAHKIDAPAEIAHQSTATSPPAATAPLVLRGAADARSDHKAAGQHAATRPLDLPNTGSAGAAELRDLTAVASRLDSTLLLYWVADDAVFVWVVRGDGNIEAVRVPVRASKLRELVRATMPFHRNDTTSSSREKRVVTRGDMTIALQDRQDAKWRQLYDLLIRPVRRMLPRRAGALLTIVPHGPLTSLSFAALQDERRRYLLEDYAVHYVPAAAVLHFTVGKRQPTARTGPVMLVADPTLPSRSRLDQPLPPLQGARTEVRAISGLVSKKQVTLLEGTAATESLVRRDAGGKGVLHFATHAIVRDDDPFGSFLALSPSTPDSTGDGNLTAAEIYGLTLRSDLVVLSACRSGAGQVTGDGIATFARAFIYAGTPSVITSLWDVADQPTNRLLPDFYRSWMTGRSKARALRVAALKLLRDLRAGRVEVITPAGPVRIPEHPVFWAGFALIGEPE